MAVLTRLKNFVSLLRCGSKTNEEEKEEEEQLEVSAVQNQATMASHVEEEVATEDATVTEDEEQAVLENTARETEETQVEMSVEEQLESLKIVHQFPYKDVKKLVKERDMDYFRDLYSTEEAIKRTDLRENQVAIAVASVSMAAYMGVLASSAVALPAVVMGLIGFGIGGGIVYAVNKITGKESAFGSLFRKLKVRFGKIRPTVNVKQYRNDFNAKKAEVNKAIDDKAKIYKDNVIAQEEVDQRFDEHIMKTARGEETTFKYEDEDSQMVLDTAASHMKDAIALNEKMITKQNEYKEKLEANTKFITDMENAKVDVENKETQSNKEFSDLINTAAIKDIEDLKEAFNAYKEEYFSHRAEIEKLNADKAREVEKLNKIIQSIERLPNKDDAKYVAAKEKAEAEIAEIDAKYAELVDNANKQTVAKTTDIKAKSVIFDKYFDTFVELCSNDTETSNDDVVRLATNYAIKKVESELDSVSLDASIGPYVDGENLDATAIITSQLDVDYDAISHKVAAILGQEYPDSDAEIEKVITDFEDRNADITENLLINFDLNIEDAQAQDMLLRKAITDVQTSIDELDAATKEDVAKARNQLKQKREILTQASAEDALETAKALNEGFSMFEQNQQEQFQEDLRKTTPGLVEETTEESDLEQE